MPVLGPNLAVVSVLNTYIVHDDQLYLNGLDAFTLCTVYKQGSVVVRHETTNYTCDIVCMRMLYGI